MPSIDKLGHSSIQPWSAGPLFPAVIATVDNYRAFAEYVASGTPVDDQPEAEARYYAQPLQARLRHVSFELIYPGEKPARYATYEGAERVAVFFNDRAAGRRAAALVVQDRYAHPQAQAEAQMHIRLLDEMDAPVHPYC